MVIHINNDLRENLSLPLYKFKLGRKSGSDLAQYLTNMGMRTLLADIFSILVQEIKIRRHDFSKTKPAAISHRLLK